MDVFQSSFIIRLKVNENQYVYYLQFYSMNLNKFYDSYSFEP